MKYGTNMQCKAALYKRIILMRIDHFVEFSAINIVNILNGIDDKDFPVVRVDKSFYNNPYIVKSFHNVPEDKTKQMPIYHMIFQLYDIERKRVASKARWYIELVGGDNIYQIESNGRNKV